MNIVVRSYKPEDYEPLKALYIDSDLYGGQFDEDRDSFDRLNALIKEKPDGILVAEHEGKICGTVSLIRDPRTAWLFRFAVKQGAQEKEITHALHNRALAILKAGGHQQVLVYSPGGQGTLDNRYAGLGFNKGGDYTCYWKQIP